MPRKNLLRSDFFPYHVVLRTNNRVPFPVSMSEVWSILSTEFLTAHIKDEVEFHAAVLMPNHLHTLLTVPTIDLGRVMNRFASNVTKDLNRVSGRSGRQFGGPYHWCLVDSAEYYRHVLKYVFRNPVKARLSKTVEEYEFSTLGGLLGRSWLPFPITFTRCGMERELADRDPIAWLNWLNQPFKNEMDARIAFGLQKKRFRPPTDPKSRLVLPILD